MSSSAEADSRGQSPVALLIIDMINDLEFPEGDSTFEPALDAARKIATLKRRAREACIPVIFANDNFGRWRSNFEQAVKHCLKDNVKGTEQVRILQPDKDDYFVLKPKHSAFYSTPLELLLTHLGAKHLILTGMSGHMCVQFTACDAYMRDYKLTTPSDCIASHTPELNDRCLGYMQTVLGADITDSGQLNLGKMIADSGQ